VDGPWLAIRDPEFVQHRDSLLTLRAEASNRPLVVALGSSRTQMALRAGQLTELKESGSPLVFNFGIPGSGPMLEQVVLRRLLAEGVRPDLLLVEVMPMSMNRQERRPLEESYLDGARLDAEEAASLLPYYYKRARLPLRWAAARVLPIYRHQAELRESLGVDHGWQTDSNSRAGVDAYGWRGENPQGGTAEAAERLRFALNQYRQALANPTPAQGPLRAFRDLLARCRRETIPVAVIMYPEGSAFRAFGPSYVTIEKEIHRIAHDFEAPVYDMRTWIDDDGFLDGHHLSAAGAERFTSRFAHDVLQPEMKRLGASSHGPPQSASLAH
jgi:hypothetical protein